MPPLRGDGDVQFDDAQEPAPFFWGGSLRCGGAAAAPAAAAADTEGLGTLLTSPSLRGTPSGLSDVGTEQPLATPRAGLPEPVDDPKALGPEGGQRRRSHQDRPPHRLRALAPRVAKKFAKAADGRTLAESVREAAGTVGADGITTGGSGIDISAASATFDGTLAAWLPYVLVMTMATVAVLFLTTAAHNWNYPALPASARVAALHAACVLGQVTHAANNPKVAQTGEGGKEVVVTLRDAEPAPKRAKRPREETTERPAQVAASCSSAYEHVLPWTPAAPCSRPPKRPCTARTRAREDEDAALQHCLGELGARLGASSREPAASRLEQLHRRVQQRLGLSLP